MPISGEGYGLRDGDQKTRAPLHGDKTSQRLERCSVQQMNSISQRFDERIDQDFYRFDERCREFEERLDVCHRKQGDNRSPWVNMAYGNPIGRLAPICRQHAYEEDSEESDVEPECLGRHPQHGDQRRRKAYESDDRDVKFKVSIPYFNGFMGIEEFLDWIVEVDRIFDFWETPPERQVKAVVSKLKGFALSWWENLQIRRIREGKAPVRTWYRMKKLLEDEFLPLNYKDILFQQYQGCHQGQKSVYEYTTEFMRLAWRNHRRESEEQQIVKYVEGLKPTLREKMRLVFIQNLFDAKNMALKAELVEQKQSKRNGKDYDVAWSIEKLVTAHEYTTCVEHEKEATIETFKEVSDLVADKKIDNESRAIFMNMVEEENPIVEVMNVSNFEFEGVVVMNDNFLQNEGGESDQIGSLVPKLSSTKFVKIDDMKLGEFFDPINDYFEELVASKLFGGVTNFCQEGGEKEFFNFIAWFVFFEMMVYARFYGNNIKIEAKEIIIWKRVRMKIAKSGNIFRKLEDEFFSSGGE